MAGPIQNPKSIEQLALEWSGSSYRTWRRALNGKGRWDGAEVDPADLADARTWDEYVDSGSYNYGDIYRGVNIKDEILEQMKVGAVIDQIGTSSWTADRGVANDFSGYNDYNRVVFVLEGGTSHGRDTMGMSERPSEWEVTVSSRSQQEITAVHTLKSGIIEIRLKEV